MPRLDHTYNGPARPANQYGEGRGRVEQIRGSFRVIRYGRFGFRSSYVFIGNGESPEKFWLVNETNFPHLDRITDT